MFFSIKNWVSSSVAPIEKPWEYTATSVPDAIKTKAQWTEWCKQFGTQHCFISAVEGATPELRVSEGGQDSNPPVLCHGVVVDYDAAFDGETVAKMKAKPKSEFMPAWIAETFSGHARLVWEFEKPVSIVSVAEYKAFMKIVAKRLSLKSWMAGWEQDALADLHKYYEIGKNWQPMWAGSKIPFTHICLWMFEADQEVNLVPNEYDVPMEEVEKKVNEMYPGRWKGPFHLGARGLRFWAPEADNPAGAQVAKDGMRVYTPHDGGFRSWKSLFGAAFVEKFQADRTADVMDRFVYESGRKEFWYRQEGGEWVTEDASGVKERLHVMGFKVKAHGNEASEVQRMAVTIKDKCRVARALPFVHRPSGILEYKGERHLNTSNVRALAPAQQGAIPFEKLHTEGFPNIFRFLSGLFAQVGDENSKHLQLECFLAWLKWGYSTAHAQGPKPGHAMIIVGNVESGKTFLSTQIMGPLLGGGYDGTKVLVDGDNFSAKLAESPLVYLDDIVSVSPDKRQHMTAAIKRLVASPEVRHRQLYRAEGIVDWFGRFVMFCNMDPFSMSMLPTQDMSNEDKLIMLMANPSSPFKFDADRDVNNAWAARELPFFARWLLDWKIPDHWINTKNPRFHIKPFKHPELSRSSAQSSSVYPVCELVLDYLDHYRRTAAPKTGYWEGTSSNLMREINEVFPANIRGLSVLQLGSALGRLKASGANITNPKHSAGLTVWRIPLDASLDPGTPDTRAYRLKEGQGTEKNEEVQSAAKTHGPEAEPASGGPVVDAAAGIFGLAPKSA